MLERLFRLRANGTTVRTEPITDGIAFGFMRTSFLKAVTRRAREAHWLVCVSAVLFVVRYVFLLR